MRRLPFQSSDFSKEQNYQYKNLVVILSLQNHWCNGVSTYCKVESIINIFIQKRQMYYQSSRERTREKSRSPRRSRDRKKQRRGRSSSSSRDEGRIRRDFDPLKNKRSVRYTAYNQTSLKFIDWIFWEIQYNLDQQYQSFRRFQKDDRLLDIKYFKKEDQPNAKNLTDADIYEYKLKLEKENYSNIYLDSQQIKHKQSLMEGDAMKKAKQNQKSLNQKLLSSKQEISYYLPLGLKIGVSENGVNSVQKQAHSERISSTLGCFYSKISEIPDEPTMSAIQNDLPSNQPPRNIAFEESSQRDKLQAMKFTKQQNHKESKPIRGILKRSVEDLKKMRQQLIDEQNRRNPALDTDFLRIFRDISTNKDKYTKQQIQQLLRPFKENGTLQLNLKKMKEMNQVTRSPPPAPVPMQPTSMPQNYNNYGMINRMTPHMPIPQMPSMNSINSMNSMNSMNTMNSMNHNNMMRNMKVEKYKTVPCKYFHGPQGCEKKTGCTFIHDQAYAGRMTPQMEMRFRPQYPNPHYMQQQPSPQLGYSNYGMMPTQPPINNVMPNMGVGGGSYQGGYSGNYGNLGLGPMPPPPPPQV